MSTDTSDTETSGTDHLEARVWRVVTDVGWLWLDRFMIRVIPLSLVGFFLYLSRPELGRYIISIMILGASVWAIADLARGIELDYEHKQQTLRDRITLSRQAGQGQGRDQDE